VSGAGPDSGKDAGRTRRTRDRFLAAGILPRLAVTVVGVPCLYLITLRGGVFFALLVGLVILLGLHEFYQLMRSKGYQPFAALGYFCALVIAGYAWKQGVVVPLLLTASLMAIMVRELMRRDMRHALVHIGVTLFGIMYLGWLGGHLVMLRELPAGAGADPVLGAHMVFYTALVTWANDTGAYLAGVAFGRHPLLPRVSPKKTVEGAVGGLIGAALVGWLCARGFAVFVTPLVGALLGLVAGLAAQVGDLVESLLKRDAGTKDSAELIPGHGGILDRFDSLLFTVPVTYYYFRLFVV
jgi:phosphatidate cytidylyltransferase